MQPKRLDLTSRLFDELPTGFDPVVSGVAR
jgi:hypothetical protein